MMIKPYSSDIINNYKTQGEWIIHSDNTVIDYKTQGEWKTQSTMQLILDLLRMHTKIYILEIMIDNEADEIIEKLFESHLQRYKKDLEERMGGSESVFDSVDLLYYKLYKISLNRGGSHIASLKWLKNKKVTITLALTAP